MFPLATSLGWPVLGQHCCRWTIYINMQYDIIQHYQYGCCFKQYCSEHLTDVFLRVFPCRLPTPCWLHSFRESTPFLSLRHLGFYGPHVHILGLVGLCLFLIDILVLCTASVFFQKSGMCHLTLFMETLAKQFLYSGCLTAHFEDYTIYLTCRPLSDAQVVSNFPFSYSIAWTSLRVNLWHSL